MHEKYDIDYDAMTINIDQGGWEDYYTLAGTRCETANSECKVKNMDQNKIEWARTFESGFIFTGGSIDRKTGRYEIWESYTDKKGAWHGYGTCIKLEGNKF